MVEGERDGAPYPALRTLLTDLHGLLVQAVRAARVGGLRPKRRLQEQVGEAAGAEGPAGEAGQR